MSNEEPVGNILEVHGTARIEWNIRNYAELSKDKQESFYFTSPTFEILAATWEIVLYPCDLNRQSYHNNYRCVSIYLKKCYSKIPIHNVSFLMEMKIHGNVKHSFYLEETFQQNVKRGSEKSLRVSDIPSLGPEDIVTIFLYIYPTGSTIKEVMAYCSSTNMTFEGIGILSKNMEDLYLKEQDCDFTIRVKTREFKVHKTILAARSPVFYSMLNHNMFEKNNGVVEIPGFDTDIFDHFLRYLYSGRVEHLSWMNVTELYVLGDMYDLQFLKKECHKYMLNGICLEKFFDILVFAIKHDEQTLLKCVKEFFVKNAKNIVSGQQWQEFLKENYALCNELFNTYISDAPK